MSTNRIERILVPLDKSELAQEVLDMALTVADRFGSHIRVLRVESDAASLERGESDVDLDVIERETAELRAHAIARAEELGLGLVASQIEAELRAGPVVQIIGETAEEHRIDLVAMGAHGRKGLTEMFTGSTTEQVVAKVPVSVLVLRPAGYPYLRD